MHGLTFCGEQTLRYESVDDPRIEHPGDVLVRVELCAVCGSDLHVYHGRERGLDHGTVMGHEFVGEVVETGAAVHTLCRGDRVLSPFTTSCGACFYCTRGLTSRCVRGQLFGWIREGQGLHGAQAEYVRVPLADSTLLRIAEGVSDDEALLLGDILSTGYFCALQAGIEPGGVYVVLGCGPVGLMAIVGARELGAERLYAVDSVPERLRLAQRFGATPIDLAAQDPWPIVAAETAGRGADAVLEVVGSAAAHGLAARLVRPGGTISVVGVHNEEGFGFAPSAAYDKNLTYRVGRCPVRHLLDRLVPLVQSRRYDLGAIVSHRMRLADGARAYELFDGKRDGCTKVVLRP